MVKAIAFDLDGLLVDSEPLWEKACVEILKSFDAQWETIDQKQTTGISVMGCAEYMCKKVGFTISKLRMQKKLINRMIALLDNGIQPMEGANHILGLTSQFPRALASSSPKKIIQKALQKNGWTKHFEIIISAEDVLNCKPAPDIYTLVCKKFEIQPDNLVVFEDSTNGILAAYQAHTRVICIKNPIITPPLEVLLIADLVLNSLNEFTLDMLEYL